MIARLLIAVVVAAPTASAAERALLVLENQRAGALAAELGALSVAALSRRGYEVKTIQGTERTDDLRLEEARQLLSESGSAIVVRVTVRFALGPRERPRGPSAPPALGLAATAWSADRVVWRASFGAFAEGKERALAEVAVRRLFWSFPRAPGAPLLADLDEPSASRKTTAGPPDYDVRIVRLRDARARPRFRLKLRKRFP